jgi:hypothetical protein
MALQFREVDPVAPRWGFRYPQVAYRYYVEQAAAFPAFIGSSWFQWVDQPCTGRMDGENYNIGLVDVTDQPYAELIGAMRATHHRLQGVHAGTLAPFATKPRAQ